ncbi:hypothetical protein CRYUN_Cryun28dG0031800 [Craigia yunnanensis]
MSFSYQGAKVHGEGGMQVLRIELQSCGNLREVAEPSGLIPSYYVCTGTVYDVTRQDTFTNLSVIWAKEIDLYSTNQDCIKMLVGNKVDKESERVVSKKEGIDFAQEYGCLFIECSAKTRVNVEQCFEELVLKILETPSLLAEGSSGVKKNIFKQNPPQNGASTSSCCSW